MPASDDGCRSVKRPSAGSDSMCRCECADALGVAAVFQRWYLGRQLGCRAVFDLARAKPRRLSLRAFVTRSMRSSGTPKRCRSASMVCAPATPSSVGSTTTKKRARADDERAHRQRERLRSIHDNRAEAAHGGRQRFDRILRRAHTPRRSGRPTRRASCRPRARWRSASGRRGRIEARIASKSNRHAAPAASRSASTSATLPFSRMRASELAAERRRAGAALGADEDAIPESSRSRSVLCRGSCRRRSLRPAPKRRGDPRARRRRCRRRERRDGGTGRRRRQRRRHASGYSRT